jgi:hypothetical protein
MRRSQYKKRTEDSATASAAVQRKPTVGGENSSSEHQADAVADKVMRMPGNSLVQRTTDCSNSGYDDEHVQLKPLASQVTPFIQAKGAEGGTVSNAVSNKIKSTQGSGSSMAGKTKSFMESRFGSDFSDVKIHTGHDAGQMTTALSAQAFTVGKNIYFNSGKYSPEATAGKRLLAHELTHVIQQNGSGQTVQRDPITGTQSSTSTYKLDGWDEKQVSTGLKSAFPDAQVSYDEASSNFTVTFPLVWIFPHGWDDAKRDGYVRDFEKSVTDAWENKFPLKETTGKKRTAHVHIAFDEGVVHQMPNAADESSAFNSLLIAKQAWAMDTRDVNVRSNVTGRTVQLDEKANTNHTIKGSKFREGKSFSVDDGNDNKSFTQNTSAHEFGHMIGLGDEYLNDNGAPVDPARGHINNRIMNVGNRVDRDAYAPFADWLSALTNTTWVVSR